MVRKVPSKWSETFNSALKCVRFQFCLEGDMRPHLLRVSEYLWFGLFADSVEQKWDPRVELYTLTVFASIL